jgi:hypothetical protein
MAWVLLPWGERLCRIGQRTFAGASSNDADAPIPDLPTLAGERGSSTHNGRSALVAGTALHAPFRSLVSGQTRAGPAAKPPFNRAAVHSHPSLGPCCSCASNRSKSTRAMTNSLIDYALIPSNRKAFSLSSATRSASPRPG